MYDHVIEYVKLNIASARLAPDVLVFYRCTGVFPNGQDLAQMPGGEGKFQVRDVRVHASRISVSCLRSLQHAASAKLLSSICDVDRELLPFASAPTRPR